MAADKFVKFHDQESTKAKEDMFTYFSGKSTCPPFS